MFITNPIRLAGALKWLSSSVNLGPMQVLAVVIDPSFRCLARLKAQHEDIHRQSEHALILVMGDTWHTSDDRQRLGLDDARDEAVRSWLPGFWGTLQDQKQIGRWGLKDRNFADRQRVSPLELILNLLGIPESALPGVFLRRRGERPVWVTLPDDDQLVDLLKQVSLGARRKSIAAILEWVELAGVSFDPATIQAWDSVLFGRGAMGTRARAHTNWSEPELARVAAIWRQANGRPVVHGAPSEYLFIVENLQYEIDDDHLRALHTALFAHMSRDWGTVTVNIGRVIEGAFARGVFAASRVRMGVRSPEYVDWWDPLAGALPSRGAQNFNRPRGEPIGAVDDQTRIPWLPPNLNPGMALLERQPHFDVRQDAGAIALMNGIARAAVALRNPPAHGDPVDRNTAEASWTLLELWQRTGCAAAMRNLAKACRDGRPEAVAMALRRIDTSYPPTTGHQVVRADARAKLDHLHAVQAQVQSLRDCAADLVAGPLTRDALVELEEQLRTLRTGHDAKLFRALPDLSRTFRSLAEFLRPRETLARRFARAFPRSGLLGPDWLDAVCDPDADREGLHRAAEFLRVRVHAGEPDIPGCRSNRNLLGDVQRRLNVRSHPKWREGPSLEALDALEPALQRVEAVLKERMHRQVEMEALSASGASFDPAVHGARPPNR